MAKARKQMLAEATPRIPRIGDRVTPARSEAIYEVTRVSHDGAEVDLAMRDTNLQRFRVRTDSVTFVDPARPETVRAVSNPTLDVDEVNARVDTVRRENLERLDSDIAILTKYLKAEGASKAVIDSLEALKSEQQETWDRTVERITDLLET